MNAAMCHSFIYVSDQQLVVVEFISEPNGCQNVSAVNDFLNSSDGCQKMLKFRADQENKLAKSQQANLFAHQLLYGRVQKRISPPFKICIWQSQSRLVFWPAHRKHPISLKKTKAKHTDLSNGPCFLYTLYILNIIWEHSDDDSRMQWIINESFAFFLMKRHDASHKTNVNWQDALECCCCPTIKVIYTVYSINNNYYMWSRSMNSARLIMTAM